MRYLYPLLILLTAFPGTAFGDNGDSSEQRRRVDIANNTRYEREYLIGIRDTFIQAYGDLPVVDIIVTGAKKTRTSVLIADCGVIMGRPLSSFNPHAALNRLKKKNIFSEINIRYAEKDGAAEIRITVEEKLTIIPIPFFSSNRHGMKYGLFVMETNLFGYAKSLFAGGTISSFGGTGFLGYIDPSIAGSRMTGNVFFSYRDEIYQHSDMYNENYREYRAAREMLRLDLGYSFSDRLRWYLSGGYVNASVNRSYRDSMNIPGDAHAWTAGSIVKYERLRHYEFLYYGPKLEIVCLHHFNPPGKSTDYTILKYKFECSFRIWNYDRLSVTSHGSAGSRPPVFEETLGGKPGGRTLPADTVTADEYLNCTLTYEYPLLRFTWGYVTLLALWEHGVYGNSETEPSHYCGPGAGTMVYLKRVAFPAMGFNVARNLQTNSTEFSVQIGFAF